MIFGQTEHIVQVAADAGVGYELERLTQVILENPRRILVLSTNQ
jgi:hypothetical protein